jgi:hypothetical protein
MQPASRGGMRNMPEHTTPVTDAATADVTGLNGLLLKELTHFTGFLHCVVPHFKFVTVRLRHFRKKFHVVIGSFGISVG